MAEQELWLRLEPTDLQCTVCIGHYDHPSTLPCGHTFCRGCIERFWRDCAQCTCPICKKPFPHRPELKKNTDLAGLLEALHAQEPRSHDNCPQCTSPGATRLCLPCMAPLCAEHALLHSGDSTQRRHLLVNVRNAAWPCRGHERGLQHFCMEHSAPVCPECVLQHEGCRTEPLLELYRRNRSQLEKRIRDLEDTIAMKEEMIVTRKNCYREMQILICDMKESLRRDFREMRDYLETQERASVWRLQREQDAAHTATTQEVQSIMADIENTRKVKEELQDCMENDWITVLKDSGSGDVSVPALSPGRPYSLDENRLVDTTDAISRMKEHLLCHPLLERLGCPSQVIEETVADPPGPPKPVHPLERSPSLLWQCATDVSFDPQTVSSHLSLSPDLKTVKVVARKNAYGRSERRFSSSQVLCREGFSSQCHYWEILTGDSDGWAVGAAAPEMGKDQKLGRNPFSWCIEWSKDTLSAWHDDRGVPIPIPRPRTVGILLDCQEKQLKFYSVSEDGETLVYTFPICFRSRVFPAMWLYGLKTGTSLTIRDIRRTSVSNPGAAEGPTPSDVIPTLSDVIPTPSDVIPTS